MDTSSKFVWLFTNEHEQVLKNLKVPLLKNVFYCENTTDRVDIIRLGELLSSYYTHGSKVFPHLDISLYIS
jgi:hypothetical protein